MQKQQFSYRKNAVQKSGLEWYLKHPTFDTKKRYSHDEHFRYLNFLIPEGLRVLDLGCGSGNLLALLKPSYGVGVDFNEKLIRNATEKYPDLHFIIGDIENNDIICRLKGPFDIIIISDIIGELDDIENCLENLHQLCTPDTRIIISYYNPLWEPFVKIAGKIGLKKPQVEQNWLLSADISKIIELAGFEVIKQDWRQLIPFRILGLGQLFNRYIATLPLIRKLCLRNYAVARPKGKKTEKEFSVSILIPCRNKKGILRMP